MLPKCTKRWQILKIIITDYHCSCVTTKRFHMPKCVTKNYSNPFTDTGDHTKPDYQINHQVITITLLQFGCCLTASGWRLGGGWVAFGWRLGGVWLPFGCHLAEWAQANFMVFYRSGEKHDNSAYVIENLKMSASTVYLRCHCLAV